MLNRQASASEEHEGSVHKCPYCGNPVNAGYELCGACKSTVSWVSATEIIEERVLTIDAVCKLGEEAVAQQYVDELLREEMAEERKAQKEASEREDRRWSFFYVFFAILVGFAIALAVWK